MAKAYGGWRRMGVIATLPVCLAGCAAGTSGRSDGPLPAYLSASARSRTALVAFDTTPFPFHGTAPGAAHPFMNVDEGGRLGHSSLRNGVLWEDRTYGDRRVLLSIPSGFDPRRPSTVVVFLHGNQATLERDVLQRQGVPRQLARSGINAVLVAPQFAVDARDSSAGRFWEPGVFAQFLDEADHRLADLAGMPGAAGTFARAPVILVGYSGGYLPAAAALRYGGAGDRVRGVVLLDALYGETDTYAAWIERRGEGFFVSLYGISSRGGNQTLERRLAVEGIDYATRLGPIEPGSVTFIDAGGDVAHGDMVTAALGGDPLAQILAKVDGYGLRTDDVAAR